MVQLDIRFVILCRVLQGNAQSGIEHASKGGNFGDYGFRHWSAHTDGRAVELLQLSIDKQVVCYTARCDDPSLTDSGDCICARAVFLYRVL